MLCVWWNSLQVVNYERLSTGPSSTKDMHSQQLELGEQPLKHCVLFPYENARLHVSRVASVTIQLLRLEILCHPPYSIFRSLDKELRWKSFAKEADLLSALTHFFGSKSTDFSFTARTLHTSGEGWEKCNEWRWGFLWRLIVCHICCISLFSNKSNTIFRCINRYILYLTAYCN